VETLENRSIDKQEFNLIVVDMGPSCMDPIKGYIDKGLLPKDPKEDRKLRYKVASYVSKRGVFYKRRYTVSLLRCVYLAEFHE